jgi:hypothetical protein
MYRAGSQIRVRISAPNGDQPIWSFGETDPAGQADVAIGYGGSMPSRLELPVIPGVSAPTALPPCPGLRGEPCREYESFPNQTAPLSVGSPDASQPSGGGTAGGSGTKCAVKHKKHKKHKKKHRCHKKKHKKKKK